MAEYLKIDFDRAGEPHDEQVLVWGEETASALLDWMRDFEDYDDKIAFFNVLERELKTIGQAAHEAGFQRGVESAEAVKQIFEGAS